MKKIITLMTIAMLGIMPAIAQHNHGGHGCGNCPNRQQHGQQSCQQQSATNADGIAMEVVKAFPTVKTVKKDKKWTEVYNAKKQLLGYAVYSKPASDGIKGYKGETPVMVALSTKKVVLGVWMLPNMETPAYAQRVEQAGFLGSWNGLGVKKAIKKKVDTVSGATYTSKAVAESVRAALGAL